MNPAEQYRPGYHYTPARNWMNDPNGLVHHRGRYHLYYQYNPHGQVWGNMSWGHASSPDLVHWTEHPVAIANTPTEDIFSGSIVVDHGNTSGFGTADAPTLVAIYTSVYPDGKQAQSLAYSIDDGMIWTKYAGNPVLDRDSTAFRDPKVSWYPTAGGGGYWVMVAVEAEAGQVVFYRSGDLRRWTLLSTFAREGAAEGLWECPDLFSLPVDGDPDRRQWVLVVSVNPGGPAGGSASQYFLGDFDGVTFHGTTAARGWLDWGRDFYAAVTFDSTPDGRRILIGWMSNWDYANEVPTSPWRGSMALPREVSLVTIEGAVTLLQRPVPELSLLDAGTGPLADEQFELDGVRVLPGGRQYRVDVTFEPMDADEFGLDLLLGVENVTRLRYLPVTRELLLDRTRSGETSFSPSFPSADRARVALRDGALELRVYVDRMSVEVFAQGGAVCMTQQVFAPDDSVGLAIRSDGGSTRVTRFECTPIGHATIVG